MLKTANKKEILNKILFTLAVLIAFGLLGML
jgi:hypothetical protein